MTRTPYQISVRRIVIGFWVAILIIAFICGYFFMPSKPKETLTREDKETGTKYVDCGNHIEARFKDGEVMYAGNENTEYENGEIC